MPEGSSNGASKDGLPVRGFASVEAWAKWLDENHASSPGLWLQIAKKASGLGGPNYAQALEEALRYGWIDSQKASQDERSFIQRFTPRKPRGRWSKINRAAVEVLIASGRMEPAGQREIDAAKRDGRWDAAYDSPSTAAVPDDFAQALARNTEAKAFFETLSSANRYAILYRIAEAKRAETRARRIEKYVSMCAVRQTVH